MSSPRPRASESLATSSTSTVRQHEAAPEASSAATPTPTPGDEDENGQEGNGGGDLPMSMTASVILTNLPKDAGQALKEVDEIDNHKVSVRFQPIGSAPILKQRVFKINASSRFSVVLNFLRKKLGIKEGDGLFLYVNSVFAPGLDEGVGNLFRVQSD
ncbi:Ubiquitin-like protein [Exophiala dermatitidis]|uniref:Ubiquitin-like protein ATG12 n=1 Tax=Exophiala dermatitidis (strain ATCC 34100 / CBS 525.76 / NIH/UT8656) TaxID=858893 RepID=H6C1C8_EXODN|nr:autophagy-like protein 12 [Exophiala dermatitidis NIH/UT8656]KAJ4513027.1 Ubiquitin-like protein [Exophiala dermatitidis]EHY57713.1 autophagy-like protein 12 [Exophiala dermatitidis NIH/UT8656]KAJ4516074.1 Ubiquitin-like protein [Exophiala dermatitidis]KAJ4554470.1 Ubiquitin-like protein [Exophiala dermatitidis]KAJ4571577.1 Ubiquitin-like protein [Exophiala dermatitidis]